MQFLLHIAAWKLLCYKQKAKQLNRVFSQCSDFSYNFRWLCVLYTLYSAYFWIKSVFNPRVSWSFENSDLYFHRYYRFILNDRKLPQKKNSSWTCWNLRNLIAFSWWASYLAINHWSLMILVTDFYTFKKSKWQKKSLKNKTLPVQHSKWLITQLIIAFLYATVFLSSFIWGFNIVSKSITSYQICVSGVLLTMCKSGTKFHSHISKSLKLQTISQAKIQIIFNGDNICVLRENHWNHV